MFTVNSHLENRLHRGHNSTSALHVQLVTELYLYRLQIYNKLEVSRLDSTLSVFIITSYSILYHDVRLVVKSKILRFYSDQTHTAFQEAFQEDLKYSDFF